jgi:hypothetical protein
VRRWRLTLGLLAWAVMAVSVGWLVGRAIKPIEARQWNGPLEYVTSVAATQANTAVSFGFNAVDVLVVNDGANEIFITFASSTATTSKFQLNTTESFTMHFTSPVQGMGIICSSGETATVRVGAWR